MNFPSPFSLTIRPGTVSRPPDLSRGMPPASGSGVGGNGGGGSGVGSGGGGKKCAEAIFDINTRLESLALSMTEHALSGPDNADHSAPI